MQARPDPAFSTDRDAPMADPKEWCDALVRDGERAAPVVIETLRAFVGRAVSRSIGGRAQGDMAFIEDVSQEATMRVLKGLTGFRGQSQFTTWATTVAVRVAFTEIRRVRWKDVSLNQLLDGDGERASSRHEPVADDGAALRAGERDELFEALRGAMKNDLTERQRTALSAELEGMPLPEIAQRLGTTSNALYKLMHDARKKLKQALLKSGITEEDVRKSIAG